MKQHSSWRMINMLPRVKIPNPDKYRDILWFPGLDPAVKVDNFGVIIHGLRPKPDDGSPWNPLLKEVFEIDHDNFTEIIQWIQNELFRCYPPRYGIIDATRDTPTSQEMEKKYGETTLKAMTMTNTLNYEMKQNGYNFLEQGYAFPNTAIMKDRDKARAVAELQLQTQQERVEYTQDNRLKFVHPPGKHNDLNRAWEMSLKAVKDFQLGKVGNIESDTYDDYPDYEINDDIEEPLQGTFRLPYDNDE